jgi:hypothetical protein
MDYNDFNTAILDADMSTIVTIKECCHGWYAPVIEEKID